MRLPSSTFRPLVSLLLMACGSTSAPGTHSGGSTCDQAHELRDGARCLLRAEELTLGGNNSCAVTSDRSLYCWGSRNYAGLPPESETTRVPRRLESLGTVVAVSAGPSHTCAVRSTGQVLCWGQNDVGQLGDGTQQESQVPVTVSGIADAVDVAAGSRHTCAIAASGTVSCWGDNFAGKLGHLDIEGSSVPLVVPGVSDAVQIAAALHHSCALLATGEAMCWGFSGDGRLGGSAGGQTGRPPAPVIEVSTLSQLSAHSGFTCALDDAGTVYCWGENTEGALGTGTSLDTGTPTPVTGASSSVAISAGRNYACAAGQDGAIRCWGSNFEGQLGDGTTDNRLQPVEVQGLDQRAFGVAAGGHHSCALMADHTVRCWGMNGAGQLGDGTQVSSLAPVAVVLEE